VLVVSQQLWPDQTDSSCSQC